MGFEAPKIDLEYNLKIEIDLGFNCSQNGTQSAPKPPKWGPKPSQNRFQIVPKSVFGEK